MKVTVITFKEKNPWNKLIRSLRWHQDLWWGQMTRSETSTSDIQSLSLSAIWSRLFLYSNPVHCSLYIVGKKTTTTTKDTRFSKISNCDVDNLKIWGFPSHGESRSLFVFTWWLDRRQTSRMWAVCFQFVYLFSRHCNFQNCLELFSTELPDIKTFNIKCSMGPDEIII